MSDDLTAVLEAIRDRHGPVRSSADDMPRVLAAIEAVLKLHKPELVDGRNADGDEFSSYQCVECDTSGVRDNWPCDTYQAITAALTPATEGAGK